ncbi:MAG: hypothetical protein Q8M24_00745 [Pseudolabrys sp.]|nr:hypothetical protein [Pseudolabrys sp.]MDP2293974.1 hypothetical protein [Pseudolabrys sp.]
MTDGIKGGQWFSKPLHVVTRADGSDAAVNRNFDLGPRGPVGPEDLVGADGRCSAPAMAEAPQAPSAPPAEPPVGSMAGDLAGSPMPASVARPSQIDPGMQQVVGGIALGMSECDAVRRAGVPANVSIGAGDSNDRRVVLTYLAGPWPGIYTFSSGRLKEISAAPVQPKPAAKPAAKRKPVAAAKPRATQPAPVQIR